MSIESDNTFQYKSIILMSVMSRSWAWWPGLELSQDNVQPRWLQFQWNIPTAWQEAQTSRSWAMWRWEERRGRCNKLIYSFFIPRVLLVETGETWAPHVTRQRVSQSVSQSVSVPFFLCRDTQLSLVTCNSLYIKFNFSPKLSRTCDVNHS